MLESHGAEELDTITNTIKKVLTGAETGEEIRSIVTTILAKTGLSLDLVDQVTANLTSDSAQSTVADQPILIAELGSNFAVGHNVRIDFHLLLPHDITANIKPTAINATQSSALDQTAWMIKPDFHREGKTHWVFSEEFSLRDTNGNPCPAGSYGIELEIELNAPINQNLKKHLRASMKIRVPDSNSGNKQKLEIDSDGDAMINLQGIDLSNYGTVSLKGSGNSLQNLLQTSSSTGETDSHQADAVLQIIIPLKHNHERSEQFPYLSPVVNSTEKKSHSIALEYPDGRRVIIFNKDTLHLGRDRPSEGGNDIALRWIPSNSTNSDKTFSISRTHLKLSTNHDGLVLTDVNSSFGTALNNQPLGKGESITLDQQENENSHHLAIAEGFELELQLLPFMNELDGEKVDQILDFPNAAGVRRPYSWQIAKKINLDAVRINRLTTLPEENYLLLLRAALIGYETDCAVRLFQYDGFPYVARIIAMGGNFYLHRLVSKEDCHITVNDHEPNDELELIPLQIGQQLRFGRSTIKVVEPLQNLTHNS